jgi:hypothetical protein
MAAARVNGRRGGQAKVETELENFLTNQRATTYIFLV